MLSCAEKTADNEVSVTAGGVCRVLGWSGVLEQWGLMCVRVCVCLCVGRGLLIGKWQSRSITSVDKHMTSVQRKSHQLENNYRHRVDKVRPGVLNMGSVDTLRGLCEGPLQDTHKNKKCKGRRMLQLAEGGGNPPSTSHHRGSASDKCCCCC